MSDPRLCRCCGATRPRGGEAFCASCRRRYPPPSAIDEVEAMLAEFKDRRAACSVTEEGNVYYALNVYVDVLLTIRSRLDGVIE